LRGGKLTHWRGPDPFLFHTNYVAEFPPLDLNKNSRYDVTFRGFPASPVYMSLKLLVGNNEGFIRQFSSDITLEFAAADGSSVCKAAGRLNELRGGTADHIWVLGHGGHEASFWTQAVVC
jgi:hypothetical protein